jgi:hypothetical protein
MQVEGRGIGTGFETRGGVTAIPDRRFSTQKEAGADAPAGAMRCDIQRRHSVLVDFDPSDRNVLNGNPHCVMQYRVRDTIGRCAIGPLFSLRGRHRGHRQLEDGAAPNRGQRRVVTRGRASNLDHDRPSAANRKGAEGPGASKEAIRSSTEILVPESRRWLDLLDDIDPRARWIVQSEASLTPGLITQ